LRILEEDAHDEQTETLVLVLVVVQLGLGLVEEAVKLEVVVVESSRASIDGADLTVGVSDILALSVDHVGPVLDEHDRHVGT